MSKSWIVISRKIPPETFTYSGGGGAGSREVMRTMCGSPIAPACTRSRMRRKLWSNLRLKPTWIFTPAFFTSARAFFTRATVRSTGFSQKMCFPRAAAALTRSACVSVELHTMTAPISGSSSTSRASALTFDTPMPRAQSLTLSAAMSAMRVIFTLGMWTEMFSAWILPILPAPIRPTFMRPSFAICAPARPCGTSAWRRTPPRWPGSRPGP